MTRTMWFSSNGAVCVDLALVRAATWEAHLRESILVVLLDGLPPLEIGEAAGKELVDALRLRRECLAPPATSTPFLSMFEDAEAA